MYLCCKGSEKEYKKASTRGKIKRKRFLVEALLWMLVLAQVDNLCLREVLGVEGEHRVAECNSLQLADVEGRPSLTLQHFHLCGMEALLVDGDEDFLYVLVALSRQVDGVRVGRRTHHHVVALFVEIDEVVGINLLQLR